MQTRAKLFAVQNVIYIAIALSVFVGIVAGTGILAFGLNPRAGLEPLSRVAGVSVSATTQLLAVTPSEKGRDYELVNFNHDQENKVITAIYKLDRVLAGDVLMPFLDISNISPSNQNLKIQSVTQTNVSDSLEISLSTRSGEEVSTVLIEEEAVESTYLKFSSQESIHFPFTVTISATY